MEFRVKKVNPGLVLQRFSRGRVVLVNLDLICKGIERAGFNW